MEQDYFNGWLFIDLILTKTKLTIDKSDKNYAFGQVCCFWQALCSYTSVLERLAIIE